jgi:hypothetical protein
MVVLATLSRLVLEDVWVKETYGERARPCSMRTCAWKTRLDLSAEF